MTNNTNSPWNDELISEITEMWKTMTASQIATKISAKYHTHFTRSSIVGKLHRLGLTVSHKTDVHPLTRGIVRPKKEKKDRVRRPILRIVNGGAGTFRFLATTTSDVEPLLCAEVDPKHITLADIRSGECRYPYGDGPFTFCGHASQEGSSYCPAHTALCWVSPKKRWAA